MEFTTPNILRTLFLVSFLVLAGTLFAETIYMKNGTELNGKIVGQTRTEVKISVDGNVRTIKKEAIRRIQYGKTPEEIQQEKSEAERERLLKEQKAEEERQKKALEAEAQKKADAERLKEEQKDNERLAKEEAKKQKLLDEEELKQKKNLAKEEKQRLKEEKKQEENAKIAHLVKKHDFSFGAAGGITANHFIAEDVFFEFYKAISFIFQTEPYSWKHTNMPVAQALMIYNRNRLFIDFDIMGGKTNPSASYIQTIIPPNPGSKEILFQNEEYSSMTFAQATSVFGYRLLLRDSFEISPVISIQLGRTAGSSTSYGLGRGRQVPPTTPYTSSALNYNDFASLSQTGMAGIHIKYKFSKPLEMEFQIQARKTKNIISDRIQRLMNPHQRPLATLVFDLNGETAKRGADIYFKTKYKFERWQTSVFVNIFGSSETGKFKKLNIKSDMIDKKSGGSGGPAPDEMLMMSSFVESKLSDASLREKRGGIVIGVEHNIDFSE